MPDRSKSRIRYAVVGLGHIAQVAVLPAFANARKNSELVALVSDDPVKRKELKEEYSLEHAYSYEEYDQLLQSGLIDAVFIALPNHMHCEYTVRAAEAGIHILCEKPMAVTEDECLKMITAAEQADVRLMIAYRLHFEKSNLKAIELVQSGTLGEPRIFESVFTQQVKPGDIRVRHETGGGTVPDIGIYCINAARYLFRDEPIEVTAFSATGPDPRFREIDEMTTAVMRFPGERLATFTSSFGASDVSSYRVVGTEGDLRVEPAYEYVEKLTHYVTVGGKTKQQTFRVRDQFAAELLYFSQCVQTGEQPEPSGKEGLADVRVIEAIYQSAKQGKPIRIEPLHKPERPTMDQEIEKPPVKKPDLVHTESPTR
ncbi:MAG: Gfo/Idh/MocA family protein [Pirellulaceae bacterium]